MVARRMVVGTTSSVVVGLLAATSCSSGGDGDETSIAAMASQLEAPANIEEGWLGAIYFNLDRYTEGTGTDIEPGTSTGDVFGDLGIEEVGGWSLSEPFLSALTRMDVDGAELVPLGDVTATYFDFEGRSLIVGDFDSTGVEERLTGVGGSDSVEAVEESEWSVAQFPQPEDGEQVIGFGHEVDVAFSDGMAVAPAPEDGRSVADVLVDDDESLFGDDAAADVADALDDVDAHSAYLFSASDDSASDDSAEDDASLAAPWDFGGLASSVVDDERRLHVVLAHADEDDAAANTERLGVVLDEWVECDGDADVETDGTVTVVSCASEQQYFVMQVASRLEHRGRLSWPAS